MYSYIHNYQKQILVSCFCQPEWLPSAVRCGCLSGSKRSNSISVPRSRTRQSSTSGSSILIQDHVWVVLLQHGHHFHLCHRRHQPPFHPLPHRILLFITHQPSPALIILLIKPKINLLKLGPNLAGQIMNLVSLGFEELGVIEDELDICGELGRSLIVYAPPPRLRLLLTLPRSMGL